MINISQNQKFFLLAILTFFFFTIADTIIKFIGDTYPLNQLFAFQTICGLLTVSFFIFVFRQQNTLKTSNISVHVIRGLCLFVCTYCIYKGIILLPLSIAYPLILSSPMILITMGIVILKEQITFIKFIALILSVTAVFLISGFSYQNGLNIMGVLYLIVGAVAVSFLDIIVKTLGKNESTIALTFYSILFSAIFFVLISFYNLEVMSLGDVLLVIISGILDGSGLLLGAYTIRRIDASIFGFAQYSQLFHAIILGIFIFGYFPYLLEIIGAILILFSGIMIFISSKNVKHK